MADTNRIADRTSPKRIAQRRTRNARRGLTSLGEKVMGTVPQATHNTTNGVQERAQDVAQVVQDKAQSAAETVSDTAGQAAQVVREALEQAIRQARGNPVAAGLVAFGAGLLVASLLPTTRVEQDAVRQVGERAAEYAEPVKEAIAESGQRLKDDLGGTVQDAVQEVEQTAGEAARTTADQARDASSDVAGHARDSGQRSRGTRAADSGLNGAGKSHGSSPLRCAGQVSNGCSKGTRRSAPAAGRRVVGRGRRPPQGGGPHLLEGGGGWSSGTSSAGAHRRGQVVERLPDPCASPGTAGRQPVGASRAPRRGTAVDRDGAADLV